MTWKAVLLAEIADISLGKMLDKAKNKGEPLPYLANINVRWGDFDLEDLRTMRFEAHELERYSLNAGDIVMCEGGEPGRCALWRDHHHRMMLQKALHRIRPAPQTADSTYLYYYFLNTGKQNGFAPYFTGSTIKHLPREQLAKFPIRLPSLSKQQRIGAALSSYDNLITTNQRRITLLEEASRLIYREWFVRLRFPGRESIALKNGIPENWKKANLFEICAVNYGYPFKSTHFNSTKTGTPAVRIRDIPDISTSTYTTEVVDDTYKIDRGDFLIGMDGIFHMNHWIGPKAYLVQRVCKVRPEDEKLLAYIGLALRDPIKTFETTIQGATVAHLGAKHLKQIEINVPVGLDEELGILNDLLWQQIHLREMNMQLAQARDLLLPKLMSGQIDVSNIQLPDEDVVT
ncbi:restriction endonuclease subunit S [Lautropia mirabilis]|jgi:probable hsdS polypeptide, part of cfrA family